MTFDVHRFCDVVLREAPDAVFYSDAEGKIQFWNRGAERIFGFGEAEAFGRSLEIIIPENLRHRHWEGYKNTMRTGETRYGAGDLLAVPAIRKDGFRISIEFTVLPFKNDAGSVTGIAAVLRHIAGRFEEMKSLRKEISALNAKAGVRK